MDYLADLPNMICSILELTTHQTAGRLRVVPLFFDDARRRRMGEDLEMMKEDGEEWNRNRRGRERESGRMGEDFERKKEDGEE